jgi:hypothetical protein
VAVVVVEQVIPPMDLLVQADQERQDKDLQAVQGYTLRRWQPVAVAVVAEL